MTKEENKTQNTKVTVDQNTKITVDQNKIEQDANKARAFDFQNSTDLKK